MDHASQKERETFRAALNARVAKDHPEVRGRPVWLLEKLRDYRKRNPKLPTVSKQTCAYWLKGEKIPKHEHVALLCGALGLSRGQLFGESEDPRLAAVITAWKVADESLRAYVYSVVAGPQEPKVAEPERQKRIASN